MSVQVHTYTPMQHITLEQIEHTPNIHILLKNRKLWQRTHKLAASQNMGAIFLQQKSACSNVPTS